jgi:hypothetical protein
LPATIPASIVEPKRDADQARMELPRSGFDHGEYVYGESRFESTIEKQGSGDSKTLQFLIWL